MRILLLILFIGISFFAFPQKKKKTLSENELLEFNSLFFDANKQKMLGNIDISKLIYEKCIKINPNCATCYYEISNIYFYNNDYESAIINSKKSISLDEDNHWYKLFLANIYQKKGDYENAATIIKQVIKQKPDMVDLYKDLSILYSYAGNDKEALNTLNALEKKIGITEEVSLEKERIYLKNNDFNKAITELEKLAKAFPFETRYLGLQAEIYVALKQFDKAEKIFLDIAKIDPNNGINRLSLADFYRMKGENKKSFEELKLAFASYDVNIDLKIQMLASFFPYSNQTSELSNQAYKLLEILLNTHPDDTKAHTINADFLSRDKKYYEARDEYRYVINIEKDKYLIWEQLLYIELELLDYNSLINESKEAIEYFPNQPLPYLFCGIAYSELKKFNEALDILKQGNDITFDEKIKSQFYLYIAEANYKLKNYSEAFKFYDKLLEIDPKNKLVLNNYSYYLSLNGTDLEKAEKHGKLVNELEPDNYTYLDTYAWVLYKLNKHSEAKEIIEKAINLGGDKNPVIIEHYGDILWKLGEKEKAKEEWKKAIEKGKGSEFLEIKVKENQLFE